MKKLFLILGFFLIPVHALFASDAETEKLQWHLGRVEWILRQVDTSSLTQEQKENRTNMIDRLHSYTEAWKFPNNDKFPWESVPFFRGSNGNLCAVGYLMDADPDYQSFIENIVNTTNNVRIMDVQSEPTLNAWAKKYGFSLLELAMIQPTYSSGPIRWLIMSCGMYKLSICTLPELFQLISTKWSDGSLSINDLSKIIWEITRDIVIYIFWFSVILGLIATYFRFTWKFELYIYLLRISKYTGLFSIVLLILLLI